MWKGIEPFRKVDRHNIILGNRVSIEVNVISKLKKLTYARLLLSKAC